MTGQEIAAVSAVIEALNVPRDRYGRLRGDSKSMEAMQAIGLSLGLPHGGADTIDQAVMVLQLLLGRRPTSILDGDRR
jgi:hypothetical protein